jgi:hypothetical protein
MVEYVMLNASAAKQLLQQWAGHLNMQTVIVAGAVLLLVWLVWRVLK